MAYKMFDCLIGINSNQLTGFYMMTTLAINELLKRLFCPGKLTYFVFIFSRSFLKFQTFWQFFLFVTLEGLLNLFANSMAGSNSFWLGGYRNQDYQRCWRFSAPNQLPRLHCECLLYLGIPFLSTGHLPSTDVQFWSVC